MTGRRVVRAGRRLAVLGAVAALTAALAQTTTTAAFTAQTGSAGNQASTATTFCASPGGSTLTPVNDTYVDESDPDTSKGGLTGLVVRAGSGTRAHALLRFSLPTLAEHCRITGATLRLHATASQGPGTIDVHRASATWTSAGTTWNSAGRPGPAGTGVGAASGTAGWHEWTVTTLVTELYAGPDHGFLVKDSNEAGGTRTTTYESMDSANVANRATLAISWG